MANETLYRDDVCRRGSQYPSNTRHTYRRTGRNMIERTRQGNNAAQEMSTKVEERRRKRGRKETKTQGPLEGNSAADKADAIRRNPHCQLQASNEWRRTKQAEIGTKTKSMSRKGSNFAS